jgi:hypothetical protein
MPQIAWYQSSDAVPRMHASLDFAPQSEAGIYSQPLFAHCEGRHPEDEVSEVTLEKGIGLKLADLQSRSR